MSEPVLQIDGISKRFGAVLASDAVSLDLRPGEIHALIGPNGAGKSTLIAQIAGSLKPDAGQIRFAGRDVTNTGPAARARSGLARSFQVSSLLPEFTARQSVRLALQARRRLGFLRWQDWDQEVQAHLGAVDLEARGDISVAELSHGERRRLEIALALATRPKALLLDEPMAGMGAEGATALTALLNGLRTEMPILLVEHDMDAVFALANRISVLVYGRVIATGTGQEIRENAEVRAAYLGEDHP